MLEITTRQFRLEEGEDVAGAAGVIRNLPGYISGTMHFYPEKVTADFAVKVICTIKTDRIVRRYRRSVFQR